VQGPDGGIGVAMHTSLIVKDDRSFSGLARGGLQHTGFVLRVAKTPTQAPEALLEEIWSLRGRQGQSEVPS
jgi:hypothetical protein